MSDYDLELDPERGVALFRVRGVLTLDIALRVMAAANDPAQVPPHFHHLIDLTQASEIAWDVDALKALKAAHARVAVTPGLAVLVMGERHMGRYMLAGLLEKLVRSVGGRRLKVFRNLDTARVWMQAEIAGDTGAEA